jgi:VIT1/CCC1 family predicted Fe2+/Mn2+ transporter
MLIFSVMEAFDRSRHRMVVDWVFSKPDEDWALDAIRDELSGTVVARLDPVDRESIYQEILESGTRSLEPRPRFSFTILKSSVFAFAITVIASLPVVLVLLAVSPVELAFLMASAIAALLLFLTGFVWAPFAGIGRWRAGTALMGIGLLITLSTLFIGG